MRCIAFRVTGVHHVAVVVDDLDAARSFYCEKLAMQEIARPQFESSGFWVQIGAQELHVSQGPEAPHKRNHFALAVEDISDAVAQLEANGVMVRRGREVSGAGRQAFLRDPWGNLIELNEQ